MQPAPARTPPAAPATSLPTAPTARGGVSIVAMVTGAMVVCAATIFLALAGLATAAYAGYHRYVLPLGGLHRIGFEGALGVGLGLFVAHLWGGYTAGRMARGAGWMNGLLVGIAAGVLVVGVLLAWVLVKPGSGPTLSLPAGLPKIRLLLPAWINGAAAAAIALVGSSMGGAWGSRWHLAMERRAAREQAEATEARETFRDLREATPDPGYGPQAPDEATSPALGPRPASGPAGLTSSVTFDPGITLG